MSLQPRETLVSLSDGASLLDQLVRTAARAAAEPLPPDVDTQREIGRLMDALLPEHLALLQEPSAASVGEATLKPIHTQIICSSESFELTIFVFPEGATIPLHDHPGMTVFSKVLYGSLEFSAYDWEHPISPEQIAEMDTEQTRLAQMARLQRDSLDEDDDFQAPLCPPRSVRRRAKTVLTPESPTFCLRPSFCNIHSFGALSACAVLDLLLPPYDENEGRDCHYLTFGREGEEGAKRVVAPQPDDLVIRNAPYLGPPPPSLES